MNKHRLNPDQFKCDWPEFKSELQKNWKEFSDDDLITTIFSQDAA